MSVANLGPTQPAKYSTEVNFWQVLENKSAYSEGTIASNILFLNNFLNLKISSQLFFSIISPLETFLRNQNLFPIKTELDYIEQRVKLISQYRRLKNDFDYKSGQFLEIEKILWLLRFQLYGFGQQLIENGNLLYGLIAFKESGALENTRVQQKLKKIARDKPEFASVIFEFI